MTLVSLGLSFLKKSLDILCDSLPFSEKIKAKTLIKLFSVIISVLIILISLSLLIKLYSDNEVKELIEKISLIILNRHNEYLFFIGTTFISILLLNKRRWILAKIIFLVGVLWVTFYESMKIFISRIGIDSLSEALNFDIAEAKFWLSTITHEFNPNFSIKLFILYSVIAALLFVSLKYAFNKFHITRKNYSFLKFSLSLIIIGAVIQQSFSEPLKLFLDESESYLSTKNNFTSHELIPISYEGNNLHLLVYIGESISIMNMGVYGYPRNTTPNLTRIYNQNDNLILFQNVFSTHTHTSPSLLEALSFGINKDDQFLPINQRKRVSIVDVLVSSGLNVELYSNQGSTGTWNQASSIIFRNASRNFSTRSELVGNYDYKIKKPADHEYFLSILKNGILNKNNSVTFFHSYAGHGGYLDNIPIEFHSPVDDYLKNKNPQSILGTNISFLSIIEEYDSAIKYIDHSLDRVISEVKNSKKPQILIYFADHGDAVFPNRGHESGRFIHEMARVPLFLYFNDAAKIEYSALHKKYVNLANKQEISTLAQLPSTLLDILGLKLDISPSTNFIKTPVIGEKTIHPPIVVRETASGISYVNINRENFRETTINGKPLVDATDDATKIFAITNSSDNNNRETLICYRRSNTIAKIIRSKLISNCFESDIVVNEKINVYHPPQINTDLELSDIINLKTSNHGIWIDGKNIQFAENCEALYNSLKYYKNINNTLVEFPSGPYLNSKQIGSCITKLKRLGVATSYYVPTDIAINCSKSIKLGMSLEGDNQCHLLIDDLKRSAESKLFTDFSFDYGGISAIESIPFAKDFKWNTWNVEYTEFDSAFSGQFRMFSLSGDDPNNF